MLPEISPGRLPFARSRNPFQEFFWKFFQGFLLNFTEVSWRTFPKVSEETYPRVLSANVPEAPPGISRDIHLTVSPEKSSRNLFRN